MTSPPAGRAVLLRLVGGVSTTSLPPSLASGRPRFRFAPPARPRATALTSSSESSIAIACVRVDPAPAELAREPGAGT